MDLTNKARLEARLHEASGDDAERAAIARLFDPGLLRRYRDTLLGRPFSPRGTTHISVADAAGNLAAMTLSNGEGCGRLLPGTGILLNNMLGEEDLSPAGFHLWRPGTRMASMMAPTIAEAGSGRIAALGSGGSNRIRSAVLQVVLHLVDRDRGAQDAVEAPRRRAARRGLRRGAVLARAQSLLRRCARGDTRPCGQLRRRRRPAPRRRRAAGLG
jgi:gamma-glutamyltranspeptidase/glutathione hydrolase